VDAIGVLGTKVAVVLVGENKTEVDGSGVASSAGAG